METKLKDLIKICKERGLPTYGTKEELSKRLNGPKRRPTIAILQSICKKYSLSLPKTHDDLIQILAKNNVIWTYDPVTQSVTDCTHGPSETEHIEGSPVGFDRMEEVEMDSIESHDIEHCGEPNLGKSSNAKDEAKFHMENMDSKWVCVICQKRSDHKWSMLRHIVGQHFRGTLTTGHCDTCDKEFIIENKSYANHMLSGHIDTFNNDIITNTSTDELRLVPFNREIHDLDRICQLVGIPWVNRHGIAAQLSIGITKYGNVQYYASKIWAQVLQALKKKQLRVYACGSAVNVAAFHEVVMYPTQAVTIGLVTDGRVIGNKVKGFIRDLLDTVRHSSSNDIFNYLQPVKQIIISKLVKCMRDGSFPRHNTDFFIGTINGAAPVPSILNQRKFNIADINSILQELDIANIDAE